MDVSEETEKSSRIFVQGLPAYLDVKRLRELFEERGEVTDAKIIVTAWASRCRASETWRGFAWIAETTAPTGTENRGSSALLAFEMKSKRPMLSLTTTTHTSIRRASASRYVGVQDYCLVPCCAIILWKVWVTCSLRRRQAAQIWGGLGASTPKVHTLVCVYEWTANSVAILSASLPAGSSAFAKRDRQEGSKTQQEVTQPAKKQKVKKAKQDAEGEALHVNMPLQQPSNVSLYKLARAYVWVVYSVYVISGGESFMAMGVWPWK